jgi:hypothetical protein
VLQKCGRETLVVLWITSCEQRIPTSCNPNQNRAALWQIFSPNKSAPANRKIGFYANGDPNKPRRLDTFLREAAQNFEVFSSIQERN